MKSKTIKEIIRQVLHEEFDSADSGVWRAGETLFVRRREETIAIGVDDLLVTAAMKQTGHFLHALDNLVIEKLIEKKLDLVPGQDTGTVSFIFPVTAYTKGFGE